jgi:hypothetical protein
VTRNLHDYALGLCSKYWFSRVMTLSTAYASRRWWELMQPDLKAGIR